MAISDNAIADVFDAIGRIYNVPAQYEYPGYISIPERCLSDDLADSENAWVVGSDGDEVWTGQLMSADGSEVVNNMTFCVSPHSHNPDVIADAVYGHGIGDWYKGGGCSDCPYRSA